MACRCALDSLYRYMYLHLGTYHNLLWHLPDSSQAQPLFDEQFVTCLSVQYFHLKSKEIRENFSGMIKKLKRNLIVLYTEINFLPNIVYWSRILLFCVQIHLLFFWRHYYTCNIKKKLHSNYTLLQLFGVLWWHISSIWLSHGSYCNERRQQQLSLKEYNDQRFNHLSPSVHPNRTCQVYSSTDTTT